ncbi:MAG: T9SS type A sorting domain-containing protein [Bacteroidales bacterium]|nr:T9SS type A sorting domain-containing protein [Bacteroidales bacterium]MCF8454812.1 T9SS type A sorting domain-containing protein [Bacteroidales bacterium]
MKNKTILFILLFALIGKIGYSQGIGIEPNTNIMVLEGTTLDVAEGYLVIKSDATGDASLLDYGTVTYSGGGEAKVDRFLTAGQWHLVSSPVTSITVAPFAGNYMQYYNEVSDSWSDITSLSYVLNPLQGYAYWATGNGTSTMQFNGTTNTSNKSIPFTLNGEGYNLVGNPYPSVLDWDEVVIPTNLSAAIWIFDPDFGDYGDYRYYIISGPPPAITATQYLSSSQGFFVRALTGPGTLELTNDARLHNSQPFYKNSTIDQILVVKTTGNGLTTQATVRFHSEATDQPDRLFDVPKIFGYSTDVPNVYTMCNNEAMVINSLPPLSGNKIVPLYFQAGLSGSYSFQASEIQSFEPTVQIYIEDVALNYFQDLRTNSDYSFAYTTGVEKEFKLHFNPVITDIIENNKLNVQCYLVNGNLHVNFLQNNSDQFSISANIRMFSVTGQEVLNEQSTQANNSFPFRGSQAVYFVHISSEKINYSTKVFNN